MHRNMFGFWVASRYQDVSDALRSTSFGHGQTTDQTLAQAGFGEDTSQPLNRLLGRIMVLQDPPKHARLRTPLVKTFTPRRTRQLQDAVAARIDTLMGVDSFDFMASLAWPLPTHVICDLLGIPNSERAPFLEESRIPSGLLEPTPKSPKELAAINEDVGYLMDFFNHLCRRKRQQPDDGLISAMVALADEASDREEAWLDLMANLIFLFSAGHETTAHLIGNGVHALLTHPDQMAWLADHPDSMDGAIEELIRYDTSVQITRRLALEDTQLGGKPLKKGESVMLLIGSANRDPEVFPNPDFLDLSRQKVNHLSFGAGLHHCLGAPLARLQLSLVCSALLAHKPGWAMDGDVQWLGRLAIRGMKSLPVKRLN